MSEIEKIMLETLERVTRIEAKIDGYNGLKEKLESTTLLATRAHDTAGRVDSNQKWLWRTWIILILGLVAPYLKDFMG